MLNPNIDLQPSEKIRVILYDEKYQGVYDFTIICRLKCTVFLENAYVLYHRLDNYSRLYILLHQSEINNDLSCEYKYRPIVLSALLYNNIKSINGNKIIIESHVYADNTIIFY